MTAETTPFPPLQPHELDVRWIVVTGWRHWKNRGLLERQLLAVASRHGGRLGILHGDCKTGADALAQAFADRVGWPTRRRAADWDTCTEQCPPPAGHRVRRFNGSEYCPWAGPRRNGAVAQEAVWLDALGALAFLAPTASGTRGAVTLLEAAGVKVHPVYDPNLQRRVEAKQRALFDRLNRGA